MHYFTELDKKIFLRASSMMAVFVLLIACSTDAITEIEDVVSDPVENPAEDPMSTPENPESTEEPATGEIGFEAGFVLHEDRRLVNLVLSSSDYDAFIEGEGDLKLVSNKVYEHMNDDFDFLIILSVEATQPADLFYGRSTSVQNKVQGLGNSTYNGAAAYGATDRLKSIIYMPRSEYVKSGPFLHEIAHTWGNKGFIPTTVGGHWGYASTAGQLGGFDALQDLGSNTYRGQMNGTNGFGSFANGGNSVPYGNLELYLMGLIPFNELESVQVAVNPQPGSSAGEFTAEAIDTYTPEALIMEHGARIPSYENSQKAFNALAVIISKEMLSDERIDTINTDLENFSRPAAPDNWGSSNNFWMATQGKASFDFTVRQESIK
ncbi:MAG: hypothetical protein Mars2KO_16280 [Maribacter sp.]